MQVGNPYKRQRRHNGRGTVFMLVVYAMIGFAIVQVFHRPVKDITGYDVDLISPTIEDEEAAELRKKHEREHEKMDSDLPETLDDASLAAPLGDDAPGSVQVIQEYMSFHSDYGLQDGLSDCELLKELDVGKTDEFESSCAMFKQRKFMVVVLDCISAESILTFLRSMAWAVAVGRTVLIQTATERCVEEHGTQVKCHTDMCEGRYVVDATLPTYSKWQSSLELSEPKKVSTAKLESSDEQVVRLKEAGALSSAHIKEEDYELTVETLVADEDLLYGLIFESVLGLHGDVVAQMQYFDQIIDKDIPAYLLQTAQDNSAKAADCIQSDIRTHEQCAVFTIGGNEVDSKALGGCELYPLDTSTAQAVATAVAVAQTTIRDGLIVMEDTKSSIAQLLDQIICYHVKMEGIDVEDFGCLYDNVPSEPADVQETHAAPEPIVEEESEEEEPIAKKKKDKKKKKKKKVESESEEVEEEEAGEEEEEEEEPIAKKKKDKKKKKKVESESEEEEEEEEEESEEEEPIAKKKKDKKKKKVESESEEEEEEEEEEADKEEDEEEAEKMDSEEEAGAKKTKKKKGKKKEESEEEDKEDDEEKKESASEEEGKAEKEDGASEEAAKGVEEEDKEAVK